MNIQKLIREMEADIKNVEDQGIKEIKLKNFKAYLEEIKDIVKEQDEKDTLQTQRDLALYNAKHATRIASYNAKTKRISDGLQALITIGQGALKSGSLINGGACVALLAFIGNIITKDSSMITGLSTALLIFGVGLLCAAAASGTTFLSQDSYESKKIKTGNFFNGVTILLVFLSYLLFLGGSFQSYMTIQDWTSKNKETGKSISINSEAKTFNKSTEDVNKTNK